MMKYSNLSVTTRSLRRTFLTLTSPSSCRNFGGSSANCKRPIHLQLCHNGPSSVNLLNGGRGHGRSLYSIKAGGQSSSSSADLEDDGTEPEQVDIIIAGGGLVGTALAVALGKTNKLSDKKILLLESAKQTFMKKPSQDESNYSNRVVALSSGSKAILDKFGIWNEIWRFQEVRSLQVWDALSDASISFNNPGYETPVSYIVENPVLAYAISKALEEVKNVEISFGSKMKSCVIPSEGRPNEEATVILDDNRRFKTKLLIGADGFNSKVRSSINSPLISFDYDRTAVVATLELSEPTENDIAWQRFLPTGGPIALLPLSSSYSSLVWSTTPERAKQLVEISPEEFVDAVNSAFWKEYPRSELVKMTCGFLSSMNMAEPGPKMFPPSVSKVLDSSRATFPLGFGHAAYYVSRRAALIGDAAHRVHPLAGQGLNLGLGDVDCLQRVIDESLGLGRDYGSLESLKEYETERQRHNFSIQSGIDFLHRLYSFEIAPVVALRSLGLSIVNSSQTLKKFIIAQAAA